MNNGFIVLIVGLMLTTIGALALTGTPMYAACGAGIAVTLAGAVMIAKRTKTTPPRR